MFNLNLLPEKEKKESKFEIYNKFLIRLNSILTILFLIFLVLFTPTFIFLFFHKSDTEEQIKFELDAQKKIKLGELEASVESNNQLITLVYDTDRGLKKINPLVSDIYKTANGLVSLQSMAYSAKEKTVEMKGESETIQNFLDFRTKIRELSYFSEVESPPENLVKLVDVSFVLTGKLK